MQSFACFDQSLVYGAQRPSEAIRTIVVQSDLKCRPVGVR